MYLLIQLPTRILANANGRIMVYTVSDETEFHKELLFITMPPHLNYYVNGFLRETRNCYDCNFRIK